MRTDFVQSRVRTASWMTAIRESMAFVAGTIPPILFLASYPTAQEFALDLSKLIAAEPMAQVEPTVTDQAPTAAFVSPNGPTVVDPPMSRQPDGENPSK